MNPGPFGLGRDPQVVQTKECSPVGQPDLARVVLETIDMLLGTTLFPHVPGPPLRAHGHTSGLFTHTASQRHWSLRLSISVHLSLSGEAETQATLCAGGRAGIRASWFPRSTFPHTSCSQDPSIPAAPLAPRESSLTPACLLSLLGIQTSLLSLNQHCEDHRSMKLVLVQFLFYR